MKNFKKLMALVIAGAMVLGTMSMAFADGEGMVDPSGDGKIAISGLDTGDTVTFYQVLEWKGNDGAYAGWSLKAPFTGFASATNGYTEHDGHTAEWYAIKDLVGDPTGNPAVDMALTSEIAGKLADLATSGGKAGTAVANGTSTLTIDGTTNTLGLYMALITPADANTVYNPVFVSADYNTDNNTSSQEAVDTSTYSDTSAAKKGSVELEKTASVDSNSYDNTCDATRIGEVVKYSVTSTIPGYGKVYTAPHFVVKDKLTYLTLNSGSVELKAPTGLRKGTGDASETATGVDYFITETTDGYTVTFTQEYLKKVNAPTTVTIEYKATVSSDAPVNKNVNTEQNEAWVEYSHNPQQESDYDYQKDDTNHYTFTIDANILGGYDSETLKSGSEVVKVGVDAAGNPITETYTESQVTPGNKVQGPLAGATFKLYTSYDTTAKTGTEYKKADNTTYSLVSEADGRITIEGLDAGVYYLVEDKAPNGYIKDLRPVKIEIVPEYRNETVTMYTNGTDWVYADDPNYDASTYKDSAEFEVKVLKKYDVKINDVVTTTHTFYNEGKKEVKVSSTGNTELPSSIVNTKGVELPSTGGMGTTLFYAIGAILVLGAGILLVCKRRMAAN